jgi:hypothetical protein
MTILVTGGAGFGSGVTRLRRMSLHRNRRETS